MVDPLAFPTPSPMSVPFCILLIKWESLVDQTKVLFLGGEGGLRASAGMAQGRARLPGQSRRPLSPVPVGHSGRHFHSPPEGALETGVRRVEPWPGSALRSCVALGSAFTCLCLCKGRCEAPPVAPIPGGNQNP